MEKEKNNTLESELVITRSFNAPRELVFKAFTQAEHLVHWWGPKGFTIEIHQLKLRPGGKFHYSMQLPDGGKMWGIFVYHEIKSPERIVFVNSFSDEKGNITRASFAQTFPLEILNEWTFTEENGKTTITLKGKPINATEEENNFFKGMASSMQQGFGGTFDQLEAYLTDIINS